MMTKNGFDNKKADQKAAVTVLNSLSDCLGCHSEIHLDQKSVGEDKASVGPSRMQHWIDIERIAMDSYVY